MYNHNRYIYSGQKRIMFNHSEKTRTFPRYFSQGKHTVVYQAMGCANRCYVGLTKKINYILKCDYFIDQPDSVSLGTDPCLANHTSAVFSTLEELTSLNKSPWQKKTPDNFNMLHVGWGGGGGVEGVDIVNLQYKYTPPKTRTLYNEHCTFYLSSCIQTHWIPSYTRVTQCADVI